MDCLHGRHSTDRFQPSRDHDHAAAREPARAALGRTGKASISAGATLAAGRLYWGSWDGYEHASDAVTGKEVWRTFLGEVTDKGCDPQHAGVTSTAAVGFVHLGASRVRALFVGGGDGSIYALRAATGKIIWTHNFGSPRKGWFIWSSPALLQAASTSASARSATVRSYAVAVVKLDAADRGAAGALQHRRNRLYRRDSLDIAGDRSRRRMTVFVTTGNAGGACTKNEPLGESMIELSAKDLSLVDPGGSRRPTRAGRRLRRDADPLRREDPREDHRARWSGRQERHLLRLPSRPHRRRPLWTTPRLANTTDTVASSAWDGERLYVAADVTQVGRPSLRRQRPGPRPRDRQVHLADLP